MLGDGQCRGQRGSRSFRAFGQIPLPHTATGADARPLTPSTSSVPLLPGARTSVQSLHPTLVRRASIDTAGSHRAAQCPRLVERAPETASADPTRSSAQVQLDSAGLCKPEADPPSPAFASAPGEETYHGLELRTRAFTPGRDTMGAHERKRVGPQCPQRGEDTVGRAKRREEGLVRGEGVVADPEHNGVFIEGSARAPVGWPRSDEGLYGVLGIDGSDR